MQPRFREPVFEFVKRISALDRLGTIIVFGSVAKGEADNRSDIDMLISLDALGIAKLRERKIIAQVSHDMQKEYGQTFQIVFCNRNFGGLDKNFVDNVFREGIILYGKNPKVGTFQLGLEPYFILKYGTGEMSGSGKVALSRKLYGYKTTKRVGRRVYKSGYEGMLKAFGAQMLSPATLLVPSKKAKIFEGLLKQMKAKYRKLDVWMSGV